jgi:hypothetical protein
LVRTIIPAANAQMSSGDDFSTSSSSSSSDDSMNLEPSNNSLPSGPPPGIVGTSADAALSSAPVEIETAYWIQRTIREAIYGRVLFAVVLQKRAQPVDGAEWEVTAEHCAVKEMSWEHIRRERDRLAEDPIKEVSAMQFMKGWFEQVMNQHVPEAMALSTNVQKSFQAMKETNIMMPLDLLSDERNLYSIMPYCDGGELFERLDMNERFSEAEARYWLDQVLNVSIMASSDMTHHFIGFCTRLCADKLLLLNVPSHQMIIILGPRKFATHGNLPP